MENIETSINDDLSDRGTIKLVSEGINKAVSGLSGMVGRQIVVNDLSLKKMMVKEVPDLFGGPEALMVGVYLQANGYGEGHMLVGYSPETAFKLISALLGESPQSIENLSEMEQSVLGEIGNIMGSFFLGVLADNLGTRLLPSPPAVMMDMAGAILDIPLANMLKHGEDTFIMAATFSTPDGQIDGKFLVVPVPVIKNIYN